MYDFIGIEDINFKSFHDMIDKSRSKVRKSWYRVGMFISKIKYKLDWYKNSKVIRVDKNNTSKICYVCGYINKNLGLSTKKWTCPSCHNILPRDQNVAINISKKQVKNFFSEELGTNFHSDNGIPAHKNG
ncbi:MAG: transposase [Methanobrevibacter sp.]|jgi:putative transposase|nr:transposase [Candidatus Methanovirga basalitermitum]